MRTIKIGIVTTNDLVRNGIESIIKTDGNSIEIVGSFRLLADYEPLLAQKKIGLLLLDDMHLDKENLMEIVIQLCHRYPGLQIAILSNQLNSYYIRRLIHSGAQGFIYKQDQLTDLLVYGIRTMATGNTYLSPKASSLFYSVQPDSELNQTDLAVLKMLADGHTIKEIAKTLGISDGTAYRARSNLRNYLDVRTNEQIIETAKRRGLLNDYNETA